MGRKEREEKVAVLAEQMSHTSGMIVCDYTGLNVEKITALRRQIYDVGSRFEVAKNTLLSIAARGTPYEQIHRHFVGQTAVAFIDRDPALLAKILTRFIKDNVRENPGFAFKIRGGMLDNGVLSENDIEQLGDLPSREVLLGQFVGLLASPLRGLVSVLADIPRKFLRALTAIAEQKKTDL